jgi:hypothetical protein
MSETYHGGCHIVDYRECPDSTKSEQKIEDREARQTILDILG